MSSTSLIGTFRRFVIVTGTDTDVGKTVATAAIAATLTQSGARVVTDKPTQTGVLPGEAGDVDEVLRLSGVAGSEGVRLRAAMAPVPAARLEGATLPTLAEHITRLRALAEDHDHVIVEGAGGLLVPLTAAGEGIADLARALEPHADVIVVTRAALGTQNHTLLTVEALTHRDVPIRGLVVGAWPHRPGPVEALNGEFFEALDVPLLGRIPEGSGGWDSARFRREAPRWFVRISEHRGAPTTDR